MTAIYRPSQVGQVLLEANSLVGPADARRPVATVRCMSAARLPATVVTVPRYRCVARLLRLRLLRLRLLRLRLLRLRLLLLRLLRLRLLRLRLLLLRLLRLRLLRLRLLLPLLLFTHLDAFFMATQGITSTLPCSLVLRSVGYR